MARVRCGACTCAGSVLCAGTQRHCTLAHGHLGSSGHITVHACMPTRVYALCAPDMLLCLAPLLHSASVSCP
jgi:hypothetical protein